MTIDSYEKDEVFRLQQSVNHPASRISQEWHFHFVYEIVHTCMSCQLERRGNTMYNFYIVMFKKRRSLSADIRTWNCNYTLHSRARMSILCSSSSLNIKKGENSPN